MKQTAYILLAIYLTLSGCEMMEQVPPSYEPTVEEAEDIIMFAASASIVSQMAWDDEMEYGLSGTERQDDGTITFTNTTWSDAGESGPNNNYLINGSIRVSRSSSLNTISMEDVSFSGAIEGSIDGITSRRINAEDDRRYYEFDLIVGGVVEAPCGVEILETRTNDTNEAVSATAFINGYDYTAVYQSMNLFGDEEEESTAYEPTAQEITVAIEYQARVIETLWEEWSYVITEALSEGSVENAVVGENMEVTFSNYELDYDIDGTIDYIFSGTFQPVIDMTTGETTVMINIAANVTDLADGTIEGTEVLLEDEAENRSYIDYSLTLGGIAATPLEMEISLECDYYSEEVISSTALINGYDYTTEYDTFHETY